MLYEADRHEFGPGKIHIVDGEDEARTMCGKWLRAVHGKLSPSGRATCKICLNAVENRAHSKYMRAEWDAEREQLQAQREAQNREWWARYNVYLASPAWRARRAKVMRRAGGTCEACLERPATEVHHLSYAHVFNEPCYELRALCNPCHESITEMDRRKAAGT